MISSGLDIADGDDGPPLEHEDPLMPFGKKKESDERQLNLFKSMIKQ